MHFHFSFDWQIVFSLLTQVGKSTKWLKKDCLNNLNDLLNLAHVLLLVFSKVKTLSLQHLIITFYP